jgi:hypothetical protein
LTETAAGLEAEPGRARMSGAGGDPLAPVVFAVLVLACFAAFLITQRLKHTPTAVHRYKLAIAFSPYPAGHTKLEAISFELANAEAVTVTIIDSAGNTVATLVHNFPAPRYKDVSLRWNGRRGGARRFGHLVSPGGRSILVPETAGRIAPPGEYRVSILRQNGQRVLLPRSFSLVKQ